MGFAVLLLLSGCESIRAKVSSKSDRATGAKIEPSGEGKQSVAVKPTPDSELLARPPNSPISLIEVENSTRTDIHPPRPLVVVEHATGGGVLRFDGQCLFLESGAEKVGILFKNPSARFDEASNELVVSGVRIRVGETMFVRASWWGGSSFSGFVLSPPPSDDCARNHYWLVDTVGVGVPTSEDLNCSGTVQPGRAPKFIMEPYVVHGGLKQQAERTFREWKRNFGVVRVCVEQHLPQRIGTIIDEQLTVNISESGRVTDLVFEDDKYSDTSNCMKRYFAEGTSFSPAQQASELTLSLRILLGNSDYQIATCDHLRSGE